MVSVTVSVADEARRGSARHFRPSSCVTLLTARGNADECPRESRGTDPRDPTTVLFPTLYYRRPSSLPGIRAFKRTDGRTDVRPAQSPFDGETEWDSIHCRNPPISRGRTSYTLSPSRLPQRGNRYSKESPISNYVSLSLVSLPLLPFDSPQESSISFFLALGASLSLLPRLSEGETYGRCSPRF